MNKFTKYITTTLCVLFLASCGASTSSSVSSSSESSSSSPSSSYSSSSQSSSSSSSSQIEPKGRNKVVSDSLYVEKVENLRDDFIIGMDCSSVLSLEESGVKYYDFDNNEQDLFKILSDVGVNHVRIRIWNDPFDENHKGYGGGNVDINRAIEIAKRVNKYGMKVIADFHYSDFWTDPGQFKAPKAWGNKTFEEKKKLLYEYTYDCMNKFKDNNIDLDIVQVGNEINTGMAGEYSWGNFNKIAALINQGGKAVKEVYPNAKVAVHFTDPGKGIYYSIASELQKNYCNYDIFGTSYYPFLHGDLDNLRTQMDNIARTFNKQVMVLETSYAFSDVDYDDGGKQFPNGTMTEFYPVTPNGQTNCFRDICEMMSNNIFLNRGIGVCYWEGAWISVPGKNYEERKIKWNEYGSGWASKYAGEYCESVKEYGEGGSQVDNQCFFDSNGQALETLKVFGMMYDGNIVEERIDDVKDVNITRNILDDFDLPSKIPAIFNNNHVKDVDVKWENYDIDDIKKHGPGEYIIKGKVDEFDVICNLKITPDNVLNNGSFEDNNSHWILDSKSVTSSLYWINVTDENVYDGDYSLGWWSYYGNTVYFDLSQKFNVDVSGDYKLSLYSIGGYHYGDVIPVEEQNNYVSIIDEDGEEVDCVDIIIKNYDAGFEETRLEDIPLEQGKEYTLIIHIECGLEGYWGSVDYINLYL